MQCSLACPKPVCAQDYNLRKRAEHLVKSVVRDGATISVTDPVSYAARFRRFAADLFVVQNA